MFKGLRLYKKEKLRGVTTVNAMFASRHKTDPEGKSHSIMAWPWRAVWSTPEHREGQCARFLITVPKKRIRKAVDRVTVRRRCREAYRLNRSLFNHIESGVDMAFIFIGDTCAPYALTEKSVKKILTGINKVLSTPADNENK